MSSAQKSSRPVMADSRPKSTPNHTASNQNAAKRLAPEAVNGAAKSVSSAGNVRETAQPVPAVSAAPKEAIDAVDDYVDDSNEFHTLEKLVKDVSLRFF